jgi:hypothetical protein
MSRIDYQGGRPDREWGFTPEGSHGAVGSLSPRPVAFPAFDIFPLSVLLILDLYDRCRCGLHDVVDRTADLPEGEEDKEHLSPWHKAEAIQYWEALARRIDRYGRKKEKK